MKKILIVSLLILSLLFSSVGCSCAPAVTLEFSNAWVGGGESVSNVIEKTTYNVSLNEGSYSNINYNLGKNIKELLNLSVVDGKIVNSDGSAVMEGTYTTTVSVSSNVSTVPFASDILDETITQVIKLESELKLDLKFSLGEEYEDSTFLTKEGDYYTRTDSIKSVIYFCTNNNSYSPIYSRTEVNYVLITDSNGTLIIEPLNTLSEIKYNKKQYVINEYDTSVYNFDSVLDDNVTPTKTRTFDYTMKTIIDNAQLLFALRNYEIAKPSAESQSATIPAVNVGYGIAQQLSITYIDNGTETVNVNSEDKEFPIKRYSFRLASMNNSGVSQLVYIENNGAENTPFNRAHMVKYIEPVIIYGSFDCMGALEYTLTKVE